MDRCFKQYVKLCDDFIEATEKLNEIRKASPNVDMQKIADANEKLIKEMKANDTRL